MNADFFFFPVLMLHASLSVSWGEIYWNFFTSSLFLHWNGFVLCFFYLIMLLLCVFFFYVYMHKCTCVTTQHKQWLWKTVGQIISMLYKGRSSHISITWKKISHSLCIIVLCTVATVVFLIWYHAIYIWQLKIKHVCRLNHGAIFLCKEQCSAIKKCILLWLWSLKMWKKGEEGNAIMLIKASIWGIEATLPWIKPNYLLFTWCCMTLRV